MIHWKIKNTNKAKRNKLDFKIKNWESSQNFKRHSVTTSKRIACVNTHSEIKSTMIIWMNYSSISVEVKRYS